MAEEIISNINDLIREMQGIVNTLNKLQLELAEIKHEMHSPKFGPMIEDVEF